MRGAGGPRLVVGGSIKAAPPLGLRALVQASFAQRPGRPLGEVRCAGEKEERLVGQVEAA